MIVVSCNYDMGLMDDLIELFMMGGYIHENVNKRSFYEKKYSS